MILKRAVINFHAGYTSCGNVNFYWQVEKVAYGLFSLGD